MIGTLTGSYTKWTLFDVTRSYGTVQSLPFSEASELIMAVGYNGQTGKGQQRELVAAHVRTIEAEMEAGTFTPTPVSAALEKRHAQNLKLNDDGTFSLTVDSRDPLLHTDGGHRFAALTKVVKKLREKLEAGAGKEKEKFERWLAQAESLPMTVTVYFDGNPAKDFVNLQAGRAVDRSHILAMSIQAKMVADPASKLAFAVAKLLHNHESSPFRDYIKFDSRGSKPLPISTLCAKGASDIATSLIGLAKVGLADDEGCEASKLANVVTSAYKALQAAEEVVKRDGDAGVLEYGKVLTPMSNEGTKGSSTMLVGLSTCLAYRMSVNGNTIPDDDDLDALVAAAYLTLDVQVKNNFSGPYKRTMLGTFAKEFFLKTDVPKHDDIPVELLRTLSCSAFGVSPLPKVKKSRAAAATAPEEDELVEAQA